MKAHVRLFGDKSTNIENTPANDPRYAKEILQQVFKQLMEFKREEERKDNNTRPFKDRRKKRTIY